MRFQKKIIIIYAVFGLLTALLLGGGYYAISVRQDVQKEYQNLNWLADQYEQQWDEYVKTMESIMNYLLSDRELLDALRTLGKGIKENIVSMRERSDAQDVLTWKITTDYINRTFYRVVLFNQLGDVTSSNNYGDTVLKMDVNIEAISWLSQVKNTKGKNILLGRHTDDWGKKSQPDVFSVVKEVQGYNLGYIEVQRKIEDLDAVFQTADENIRLLLIDSEGEVLYTTGFYENLEFYCTYVQQETEQIADIATVRNDSSEKSEVLAFRRSKENGVNILVVCDLQYITAKSFYIIPITILLAGGFFVVSFLYTWTASKRLTKPIRELREFMDNTRFEDGQEVQEFVTTNDEIELLNRSYKDVLERLDISIRREKRMSILQLQAQNDLLQAQINPHFIYNVLNVISARGIENEDDEICEICGSLAQMLRYSTSTKKRNATIREELEYVEQYFYLLKSRYEYRLHYEICVDTDIYEQLLPKIVLQQIVENSINHGYKSSARDMHIVVRGGCSGKNWYLEVCDDGDGFTEQAKEGLEQKITDIRQKLLEEQDSIEMEIGGMGLVNTYARLFMVYRENLRFEFKNQVQGARVMIAAPFVSGENA